MDFNSLGAGQPFYILNKSEKPILQIGTVKSKSEAKLPYNVQKPAIFNGLNAMNGQGLVVDVVVNVDGSDMPFGNLPVGAESTTYNGGNTFVCCSRESMLQAVDNMVQASKKAKELMPYHDVVIEEGEKMFEVLNPRYKEEKERDRNLKALEERQNNTDKKLDTILAKLNELFEPTSKKS